MRWRSAFFSYRAHWSKLVNRSLPAHWLSCCVEESDCAGATVGSNCWESAVLPLTCATALSLTHWQSALYVWKWAIITIICVPSLVFYNGVIILFFPLHDAFFPLSHLLFHFGVPSPRSTSPSSPSSFTSTFIESVPQPLSLLLMPSTSFTLSLIQMTGTGALLIMLRNISPLLHFPSPYHRELSADASLHS